MGPPRIHGSAAILAVVLACGDATPDDPDTAGGSAPTVPTSLGGSEDGSESEAGSAAPGDTSESEGGSDPGTSGSDDDSGGDGDTGAELPFDPGLCGEAPPEGAPMPPAPPAYSGGACPMLQPGYNTGFMAGGLAREFALILPSDVDDTGSYPLMFAWYHISGNAMDFVDEVGAQALADTARGIIVVPQDSGMFEAKWPATPLDIGQSGVDLALFDDLHACISQQFAVNQHCVSTIGVSAGGLWTSYLGTVRGQYFASDITISGGHPSEIVGPWWPWVSPRRFAGLVMWGGPTDKLGIDFHAASLNLVGDYGGSGHFTLRCEHTGGHGLPPPGDGDPLLTALHFVRNHPYWLDGESPLDMGLPSFYPSFCTAL